jgi:hypothetical protein
MRLKNLISPAGISPECDGRHFLPGNCSQHESQETKQCESQEGMSEMTYRQPTISFIDIPVLLLGVAIATPFVLVLVAPFTAGL